MILILFQESLPHFQTGQKSTAGWPNDSQFRYNKKAASVEAAPCTRRVPYAP